MHSRAQFPLQVLLLSAALCLGVARTGHATGSDQLFNGTISGFFSSPVVKVSPCNPPSACGTLTDAQKNPVSQDNSLTAETTGLGTDTFTFGSGPSKFVFVGGATGVQVTKDTCSTPSGMVACTNQFKIGTFYFTNGSNTDQSIVFGVTLNFLFTPVGGCPVGFTCPFVTPGSTSLNIYSTNNAALDPSDSVSFNPDIASKTFHVPEGSTDQADILGRIAGDPFFVLTDIILQPGGDGFITVVPGPGSVILLGLGLGAIALIRRLRPVKR